MDKLDSYQLLLLLNLIMIRIKAFLKNLFAAFLFRFELNMKSIVSPFESTAQ